MDKSGYADNPVHLESKQYCSIPQEFELINARFRSTSDGIDNRD